MAECVTADDVERAVRLLYDYTAQFPDNGMPPFDEWVAEQRKKKGGGSWRDMLPDSIDPLDYEDFAPNDAALLLKVAKVVHSMHNPPAN